MHRRVLLSALACWPGSRLLAQEDGARPRHKISAAELHERLSARFPVRLGLTGLLELHVSAPRLLLLPARNKVGAALVARASGQGMPRTESGEVDVVFGLRYEAADRTLRAHQPEILDLRLPGLSTDSAETLRSVLPRMTREAVGEIVLHQFSQRELALPDTMGFEPDQVTVVDDGLLVTFRPKPRR